MGCWKMVVKLGLWDSTSNYDSMLTVPGTDYKPTSSKPPQNEFSCSQEELKRTLNEMEKKTHQCKNSKTAFLNGKDSHSIRTAFSKHTLSINLLAWRLKLLKNIFLLSKCISSMVVNNVVVLFPIMPLKAKNISSCKAGLNNLAL